MHPALFRVGKKFKALPIGGLMGRYDFSRVNLFDNTDYQGFVGATVGTSSSAVSSLTIDSVVRSAVQITQGITADQADPPQFSWAGSLPAGTVLYLSFYYQVVSGTAGMKTGISMVAGATTYYLSSDTLSWTTTLSESILVPNITSTALTRVVLALPPLPGIMTSFNFGSLIRIRASYVVKLGGVQLSSSNVAYESQPNQALADRSVSGTNLLTPALVILGGWTLGGTPLPTYNSAIDRLTFGTVGTVGYLLTGFTHPGANNPITFTFKARGDGTVNIYFSDNSTGPGTAGYVVITLTATLTEYSVTTAWPATTAPPVNASIQRSASSTATYIEASSLMVSYGAKVNYEHPLYGGILGASTGIEATDPTWSAQGLVFDGVDDFVTLPNINLGGEHTIIVVASATSIATTVGFQGSSLATTFMATQATTGALSLSLSDSIGQKSVGYGANSVNTPFMATKRVSQSGQYIDAHLNAAKSPQTATVGAHAAGVNIQSVLGKTAGGYFWPGTIYYAAFYNRVLTDAEVQQAYIVIKKLMLSRGVSLP